MELTLILLLASFATAAVAVAYAVISKGRIRDEVVQLLSSAQESFIEAAQSEIQQRVPELKALKKDLESAWGKASRTIRTAKKATGQPPDDEDALWALDHPLVRGLAEGAGVDVEAVQQGDFSSLEKLKGAAGGGDEEPQHLL